MAIIQVFYQTLIAFLTVMIITRILGKQQIGEMTFTEYVNGITFGSIAANLATELDQNIVQHIISLIMFGVLTYGASWLALHNRKARKLLQGEPIVVIKDGKLLEKNLQKTRFTLIDITQLLRGKEVFNIDDVQYAILENDGTLSVMLKPDKQPLTPQTNRRNNPTEPQIPTELVVDGQVIYENLRRIGQSGKWLMEQLKAQKSIQSIQDVFYATLDSEGKLYIDLRDDHIKREKVDRSFL
ncbi:DUF421 domain-containing protein [Hazenella sp. IB182357]|uniref:DUF421 domain-containing protein n=1 Tax=Polycladospora coralii TaxID=2771432 RepID=A0A926RUP4_9BACL|nr:DUF421 domain-containing protein [Polycladospora coralii]MBD1373228.1 DUF421 domain-containing protein [Polycladospora coralii]